MNGLYNEYVSISTNTCGTIMNVVFNGFVPYRKFVEILEYEYEYVSYHKLERCIIDLQKMKVYASGAQDYIKETWFPQMSKLGMKKAAFVVPESVLAKSSMRNAHFTSTLGIEVDHFDCLDKARSWVMK